MLRPVAHLTPLPLPLLSLRACFSRRVDTSDLGVMDIDASLTQLGKQNNKMERSQSQRNRNTARQTAALLQRLNLTPLLLPAVCACSYFSVPEDGHTG